jgi:hypothetical protein
MNQLTRVFCPGTDIVMGKVKGRGRHHPSAPFWRLRVRTLTDALPYFTIRSLVSLMAMSR